MKNQLQYTTVFVVMLLLVLGGALYILDSSGSNQLTSAAVSVNAVDCSIPLAEDANAEEIEMYNKFCDSEE